MHIHMNHIYMAFRQYEQVYVVLVYVWLQMLYRTVHIDKVFHQYESVDESEDSHDASLHSHKDHIYMVFLLQKFKYQIQTLTFVFLIWVSRRFRVGDLTVVLDQGFAHITVLHFTY